MRRKAESEKECPTIYCVWGIIKYTGTTSKLDFTVNTTVGG